jgi:hypothetical protein
MKGDMSSSRGRSGVVCRKEGREIRGIMLKKTS